MSASTIIQAEAVITVPFEELQGSPAESVGKTEGLSATRVLRCAWADRLRLAEELFGVTRVNGTVYTNFLPHRYPDYKSAFVQSISNIQGFQMPAGEPSGENLDSLTECKAKYSHADLTVNYAIPSADDLSGIGMFSESLEPSCEFINLPVSGLSWESGGGSPVPASEAPGFLIRMLDWTYSVGHIFAIQSWMLDLVGCCNVAAVKSPTLNRTFAAETVLYNPPTMSRDVTLGDRTWKLTWKCSVRRQGWNKFPRVVGGVVQFVDMYKGTDVVKPYTPGDFSPLIMATATFTP